MTEIKNLCVMCNIDLGPQNPRQLCGKTYCYNESTLSETIDEHEGTFRFPLLYFDENNYCDITIKVTKKLRTSDQKTFYDILFFEKFGDNTKDRKSSPFHENTELGDEGEIENVTVAANEMTEMMVKYLLLSDAELEKHIANDVPSEYRRNIISSILKFWD